MTISNIINEYGKRYSPYMSGLVSHLPMAQFALYKITGDLERVKEFTEYQLRNSKIDLVRENYPTCTCLKQCFGKRDMYESYLDLLDREINEGNAIEYTRHILNKYPLGISSGLFHTTIRLYFALEGFKMDSLLIEEVKRSLAYYVTAYREADLFTREIGRETIVEEMQSLIDDEYIEDILNNEETTGKRIRALYKDDRYMKKGFVVKGNRDEKAQALLDITLPIYINSGNIIALHCITGLQALLGLEEYYDDFENVMDILTTSIITHLITIEKLKLKLKPREDVDFSWQYILSLASESNSSHNIKFTYSTDKLYEIYARRNLKRAALKRVDTIV